MLLPSFTTSRTNARASQIEIVATRGGGAQTTFVHRCRQNLREMKAPSSVPVEG